MNLFDEDLISAYADGLVQGPPDYHERLHTLFPEKMAELAPLIALTERLFALYRGWAAVTMPDEARSTLKERLLIEMARQQAEGPDHRLRWQWAALGASFTVAGALAARAWRDHALREPRNAI